MKSILTFVLALLSATIFAQLNFDMESIQFFQDLKKEKIENPNFKSSVSENLLNKYAVNRINGMYYVSFLAIKNKQFSEYELKSRNILIGSEIGNYITMRIPLELMNETLQIQGIDYIAMAKKIKPNLNKATKDTRVDSVQHGFGLPKAFTGKDVIIGITDWGFDYSNPNFYDTNLTQTRIIAAWDQFRNSGPAPAGYSYGTELIGATALLQAKCDTFNIYEWATHGSHVAGIAGGTGFRSVYRGVAFDANYLMATFLVDEAAVVDAFMWMKDKAVSQNKRLVINMSWGLYWMGNLDGTSLVNQIIDQISTQYNVVFVSSAGNNGDENLHIKKTFSSNLDTLKTVIGFNNYSYYPTMWGQSITAWGQFGKQFSVALRMLNSSNQTLTETQFYPVNNSQNYIDTFIVNASDTVYYTISFESANAQNQRPHIRLRVKNTNTAYKIALLSVGDTGSLVHFWNVIELTNDVGNWGGPFVAALSDYTTGDALYSIGDPASTKSVITVAAHTSDTYNGAGTLYPGGIASFSSYGPTLDERMKPDISAPGVSVSSSISSYTNQSIAGTSITYTDTFNGRTYKFARFSGTSMSGPMVTGIVALILEANPHLSPAQIKEILHETAREDSKTGDVPDTGSTRWGYGKVNALAAIKLALTTTKVYPVTEDSRFLLYPNPAQNKVWIISDKSISSLNVEIYNSKGVRVFENRNQDDEAIDISLLPKGLYIIKIQEANEIQSLKFIKE